MLYLSRLIIDPYSNRAIRETKEPYEMHRTLMHGFRNSIDGERILFRLDEAIITVQSTLKPSWPRFDYLLYAPEVRPINLNVQEGQEIKFRLRANPTVKRNGKRHGLYRKNEQMDWLMRKAENGGFEIISANVEDIQNVSGRIRRHRIKLLSVEFRGMLRVIDVVEMQRTVRRGIGSGKGLGFGLLFLDGVHTNF